MRARQLRKRIQIWQSLDSSDGFGGYTTVNELITSSWANITTLANNRKYLSSASDLGIDDITNTIVVKVRKRNDIVYNPVNQYIVYRDEKYIIQTDPTNTDFTDSFIEFIATRQQDDEVNVTTPIGATPIYVNYVNNAETEDGVSGSKECLKTYVDSLF